AFAIIVSVALLVYWHRRRGFSLAIFAYSFVAYAAAIALKYAVQIPTVDLATSYFGRTSVGLGVYYGVQTAFFEVGLAYLVAWYAVKRGHLARKDAEGYGAGLAFWENAVLLGALPLVNLVADYAILSGSSSLSQTVYGLLSGGSAYLFDPVPRALVLTSLGAVERLSSILLHTAWGYLCVMAAVLGKRRLFFIALPMGFVDFFVPFATSIGLAVFEALVFAISLAGVLVAWYATRDAKGEATRTRASPVV
ncbi:MAG: YhfC family intramembrane metalloprotease, partial [Thaumarchaeota archaeon]|nr:YhfC family intramembrane metalloprotease [Nitrososphaerota archaeon]